VYFSAICWGVPRIFPPGPLLSETLSFLLGKNLLVRAGAEGEKEGRWECFIKGIGHVSGERDKGQRERIAFVFVLTGLQ
jgi:hypothetical protein